MEFVQFLFKKTKNEPFFDAIVCIQSIYFAKMRVFLFIMVKGNLSVYFIFHSRFTFWLFNFFCWATSPLHRFMFMVFTFFDKCLRTIKQNKKCMKAQKLMATIVQQTCMFWDILISLMHTHKHTCTDHSQNVGNS